MRIPVAAAAVLVLVGASSLPRPAQGQDVLRAVHAARGAAPAGAWREGQVIVAFRSATEPRDVDRAIRSAGAREERRSRSATRYLVSVEPGTSVPEAVLRLARMPEVAYVEPNGLVRQTQGTTFKPDDRFYRYQWNFTQVGAERTWGIQKGKASVAVAVLDSGVAYEDYTDPSDAAGLRQGSRLGGHEVPAGLGLRERRRPPERRRVPRHPRGVHDRGSDEQQHGGGRARLRLLHHAGQGARPGRRRHLLRRGRRHRLRHGLRRGRDAPGQGHQPQPGERGLQPDA